jgi:cyclophilin family peptidyl-prolyl cis-trans isomerase
MNRSHSGTWWLCVLALAFVVGCGSSDDPAADSDDAPGPTASETPDDVPVPGVPQPVASQSEFRPRVQFETSLGSFVVVLHGDRVPKTVENFLGYVDGQFYNGTVFHQVAPDYAIVGGRYTVDTYTKDLIEKRPRTAIRSEAPAAESNLRGTIAMKRDDDDADSATCEFFINVVDNPSLDYSVNEEGFCVFGDVEPDDLPVVSEIANAETESRNTMDYVPVVPVVIYNIRRL